MTTEKRDFDLLATAWDELPRRAQLAADVAAAIIAAVKPTPEMDVLDFGCGTGLLTLQLQPLVRSITGLDTSQGMLDMLREKIVQQRLANVHPLFHDPAGGERLAGRYDLIVSSMTFHHIPRIPPLVAQMHAITAPGGTLCIADLDSDGGRFHENPDGVFHHGFEREELCRMLRAAGYEDVCAATVAEVAKPDDRGESERFTIFLVTGRKSR